MGAIGFVSGTIEKEFIGELRTLSIWVPIEICCNRGKGSEIQPDYRVYSDDVEIGAGWVRLAAASERRYVSLALEAPEFGQRRLYANLARAAGQDNADAYAYALLWNPVD